MQEKIEKDPFKIVKLRCSAVRVLYLILISHHTVWELVSLRVCQFGGRVSRNTSLEYIWISVDSSQPEDFLFSGSPDSKTDGEHFILLPPPPWIIPKPFQGWSYHFRTSSPFVFCWKCPRGQFPASNCLAQRIMVTFSTTNNDGDSPIGNGCHKTNAPQTIIWT